MKTNHKFTPEQEAALSPYGKKPGGWLLDGPKIPIVSPVCTHCSHYQLNRKCNAFPAAKSIPMEIWLGENLHTSPYPGDHGIQFERALESSSLTSAPLHIHD